MMRQPRRSLAGLALALLLLPGAVAAAAAPCSDLGRIPVQEGGRVKPFDSWAREILRGISGKQTWDDQAATAVLFGMLRDGDAWKHEPMIRIELLALKEKFGLDMRRKYFSFEELSGNEELLNLMQELRTRRPEDFTRLEAAVDEVHTKLLLIDMVARGRFPHVVPAPRDVKSPWLTIAELEAMEGAAWTERPLAAWSQLVMQSSGDDPAALTAALAQWRKVIAELSGYAAVQPRRLDVEVVNNSLHPFQWAWILYFVAFVFLLLSWLFNRGRRLALVGNLFLWAGFLFHTIGLAIRQYLAGRAPMSNLYESTVFIAWGIVLFSVIYELVQRRRIHGTVAAALGTIALVLAEVLPIERELNPLVAVLRSYWLQYHVATILLGYSALTLCAGLAHFHLALEVFSSRRTLARYTASLNYTMLKIGVTFLAAGIVLGAIWASQSWGRYWGWDPKETWSLITLLGYLVVLHGRFAGWLGSYGVSVATVICWGLILFTYYGVNFFLVGLHSYAGEAEVVKLPTLLILYLVIEVAVVVGAIWYARSGRLAVRRAASN